MNTIAIDISLLKSRVIDDVLVLNKMILKYNGKKFAIQGGLKLFQNGRVVNDGLGRFSADGNGQGYLIFEYNTEKRCYKPNPKLSSADYAVTKLSDKDLEDVYAELDDERVLLLGGKYKATYEKPLFLYNEAANGWIHEYHDVIWNGREIFYKLDIERTNAEQLFYEAWKWLNQLQINNTLINNFDEANKAWYYKTHTDIALFDDLFDKEQAYGFEGDALWRFYVIPDTTKNKAIVFFKEPYEAEIRCLGKAKIGSEKHREIDNYAEQLVQLRIIDHAVKRGFKGLLVADPSLAHYAAVSRIHVHNAADDWDDWSGHKS